MDGHGPLGGRAGGAERRAGAPSILGSAALYRWLATTAAQSLKASEANNDLRPGGLLALNQGAKSGLAQLSDLAPAWLAEIDPQLTLRQDLSARYGLRARRSLYEAPDEAFMVDTFGGFTVDQAGRTSGEFGLGLEAELRDDILAIDLVGVVDHEWRSGRERYTTRVGLDWWRLSFTGSAFNDTTTHEPTGALYEERLIDGLDLNLETGLPFVPWLMIGTRQTFRPPKDPNAGATHSFRHSFRLRPLAGLEIEAGTEAARDAEAKRSTGLRYVLQLGG